MKLIITTLLSFFTLTTVGQFIEHYEEFPDLFDLYTFEKYEKCLKKAVRYTDQDKYRR